MIGVIASDSKTVKNILQRHGKQLESMNSKIAMLSAKSMENNVTISNLEGDTEKESVKQSVVEFFKKQLEIDAEEEEIYTAYRVGKLFKEKKRPRIVVARLKYRLKERIFDNIKNLKGKTNPGGAKYYINKQLPEQHIERNKRIKEQIREQKDKEKKLPPGDKSTIEVKSKVVLVDSEPFREPLPKLEINDLFSDSAEKDKQAKIQLFAADPITQECSNFMAYAVKVHQLHEVKRAYKKVRALHPVADHVVVAYSIKNHQGFQDDGEVAAGRKILQVMQDYVLGPSPDEESDYENDSQQWKTPNPVSRDTPTNTAVFVVRECGPYQIGAARFACIKKIAKEAIARQEFP